MSLVALFLLLSSRALINHQSLYMSIPPHTVITLTEFSLIDGSLRKSKTGYMAEREVMSLETQRALTVSRKEAI